MIAGYAIAFSPLRRYAFDWHYAIISLPLFFHCRHCHYDSSPIFFRAFRFALPLLPYDTPCDYQLRRHSRFFHFFIIFDVIFITISSIFSLIISMLLLIAMSYATALIRSALIFFAITLLLPLFIRVTP